ncbi:heat shock protein HslJ [Neisseria sp. HSC-16F19]|nr:META domain-containing protein [Neisseria sp. HSC-16F19]MCP2040694.1 heat shock protein HslJ [Neisseria sp. HSC-16F19]
MKPYLTLLALPLWLAACQSSGSPAAVHGDALPHGEWRIVRIDDKPVSASDYRLNISTESLGAYFGCNRIHARYRQQGDTLAIDNIASTKMYCGADSDEIRGLAALHHSSRWQTDAVKTRGGQRLTFFDATGRARLEMQSR